MNIRKNFLVLINFFIKFFNCIKKMSLKFLSIIKKYEESNLFVSCDNKFRKVHDNFMNSKDEKSYLKLVKYLRNISNENCEKISPNSELVFFDDDFIPVFNSFLNDDDGNTFSKYKNGKINFNNKYQKKSAKKSDKQIINVTVKSKKKKCGYRNLIYVSNFTGTGLGSGVSIDADSSCTPDDCSSGGL